MSDYVQDFIDQRDAARKERDDLEREMWEWRRRALKAEAELRELAQGARKERA